MLERELVNYEDKNICKFLKYGFLVGYSKEELPISDSRNHRGAELFPDTVDKFIETELSYNAILGPFPGNPLYYDLAFSLLITVEKDETSRRVIVDLSWPDGTSVNSDINKGVYLGKNVSFTYPTIDTLTSIIVSKGLGALMFKTDMSL